MLRLGNIELDIPVVQASLSGYSDLAMRRVARRHGAPFTISEVVLDKLVTQKGKTRRRVLHVPPDDHPLGGQLMGAAPAQFANAAGDLVEAGYDLIDINFGCPVKKVLGRCRGGFLLSQPDTALSIVREVYGAVAGRRPVTVKMRRGMDDTKESRANFFKILDGAFDIGVQAITVHARTVRQRYAGPSQWEFLAEVKRHVGDRTILGSGDLFGAKHVKRMFDDTGVDGAAIARGCIGNPWIFNECRALLTRNELPAPPSIAEQGETIRRHYAWGEEIYGPNHAGKIMRKFGIKYSELHPLWRKVRDAFISVKSRADFFAVLDRFYDPDGDFPPVVRKESHGDLISAGAAP